MSTRLLLIPLVAVVAATTASCQTNSSAAPTSEPTSKPAQPLKIIPWVEMNRHKYLNHAVEGLRIWRELTDTAIVSTKPGYAVIYTKLRQRVPGMRILPGMKTVTRLERFDSMEGWRAIAQEVNAVCAASGERIVLLENETAFKRYWRDREYEIDLGRLRKALQQLPSDVKYIWRPGVACGSDEAQQRRAAVCQVVEEVLDVRFIDASMAGPGLLRDPWIRLGKQRLEAIASKPTIPILLCYGPGARWWQDQDLPRALAHIQGGWVILYPGIKRWPEAARSITKVLAELPSQETP